MLNKTVPYVLVVLDRVENLLIKHYVETEYVFKNIQWFYISESLLLLSYPCLKQLYTL